jgi:CheY-like chemotaxis protein
MKTGEGGKDYVAARMTGTHPLNILVVDDELNIRKTLTVYLETEGHHVVAVSNFQDAAQEASRRSFDLAFVDLRLGTADGLDLIPTLLAQTPWIKIVVITAYASIDTAVEAMRRGATDSIPKPLCLASIRPPSGAAGRSTGFEDITPAFTSLAGEGWLAVYRCQKPHRPVKISGIIPEEKERRSHDPIRANLHEFSSPAPGET